MKATKEKKQNGDSINIVRKHHNKHQRKICRRFVQENFGKEGRGCGLHPLRVACAFVKTIFLFLLNLKGMSFRESL